jgi:hypothetical protein
MAKTELPRGLKTYRRVTTEPQRGPKTNRWRRQSRREVRRPKDGDDIADKRSEDLQKGNDRAAERSEDLKMVTTEPSRGPKT